MTEPSRDLAVPEDGELEGAVVSEQPQQPRVYVLRVVRVAVTHPAPKAVARHAGYVPAGVVVAWRRWRHARQRPERMMQMAETAGDHAQVIAWRQQLEQEKQDKHGRIVKAAETVVLVGRNILVIGGALLGCMLVLSLLLALKWHLHGFLWPWETAAAVAVALVSLLGVLWVVLALGFTGTVLGVLHELGRRGGSMAPGWTRTSADADIDVSIDELTITNTLKDMRIPQVKEYLAAGRPLQFVVQCRQEGRGTGFEVRLPGVPAERIIRRRTDFAAGVHRLPKETWLYVGSEAAILRGWIADKGALEEGAGDYPLLGDGACDVFKGVPFGRTLRGDPVMAPLMERNTICGGMPGQGKSSAARVIMLGAALDPTAELWIMVPDVNFDFEHFRPRCTRYVMGAEDEYIGQVRDWLSDLRDEVQARGQLLVEREIPSAGRKAGPGLHPMVVLLEEAHVAIQHPQYGKEIAGLLVDVVKLGRKRGIHVIVSTQAPTKDSMPRDVTRNCSNGIAFAVGDHVANDALLGQGAYSGGHRATELIPGTDKGVALVKGFSGERSEMVQVYFVHVDQVPAVIGRAMAEVTRRGGLPGSAAPVLAIESRDLLTDLAAVLDSKWESVRIADVPSLLRGHAPSWLPYRRLTGVQLREQLGELGVRTTNPGNVPTLAPGDLRRVVAEREVS